ncbi:MAG: hypothetical protein KKF30_10450 [Proteobacteria bacterium]|nr:hypothetical protein [Pseudomonadota bacterium]MCG2752725.1 hypothetical protein [Desulfobacteraceae bacterium]
MNFDLDKILSKASITIPKGVMPTSGLTQRINQLRNLSRDGLRANSVTMIDPGDFARLGGKNTPDIQISAPIASDIWYFWKTKSILPEEPEESEEFVTERMAFLVSKWGGIRPLRTVNQRKDLLLYPESWSSKGFFENNGPYCVKEMRYEMAFEGRSILNTSQGQPEGVFPAFLAFPVGQLGVMRILSIMSESMAEAEGFEIEDDYRPVTGGEFFPPVHTNGNKCIGLHLYENCYQKKDSGRVEYPAGKFGDDILPHLWMKYYIKAEDTWPVPGEFIGLLCKPLSVPPHVWWFQETSPFLVSGNWFETSCYTSGIIKEVMGPIGEEAFKRYKIKVQGAEIVLAPSDFYEYAVGERVAVIRSMNADIQGFSWIELVALKASGDLNLTMFIAPISFYSKGGV